MITLSDLLKSVGLVYFLITLTSCASIGLPTKIEKEEIASGKTALILLRIKSEDENGNRINPVIRVGLAKSAIIGGKVKPIEFPRSMSLELYREGWTYLLLNPGLHYFVFQGPQLGNAFSYDSDLRYYPRWQVNIPHDFPIIYIGTVHFFFKDKAYMVHHVNQTIVKDEEVQAELIVKDFFHDIDDLRTILLKK